MNGPLAMRRNRKAMRELPIDQIELNDAQKNVLLINLHAESYLGRGGGLRVVDLMRRYGSTGSALSYEGMHRELRSLRRFGLVTVKEDVVINTERGREYGAMLDKSS